ncbi:glycosyltransferase [Aurantimonas sp. E1-2-R+4]|uniref:glycosyltransferase n=1 Tax=Aurantimonas sp. E1-2-R+4 TaxID=3113714 RepID=UPI002F931BDB
MKILLTTISLDPEQGGGTAARTYNLARHLSRLGNDCTVATIQGGEYARRLNTEGIATFATGFWKLRFVVPQISPVKLAAEVRQADVVHILGYWNILSVATAFLASNIGTPYVLSAAGEFVGLEGPRTLHKRVFHRVFGRRMICHASRIIAVTPLEKEQIIGRLGLSPEMIEVVSNGVEGPATAVEYRHGAPVQQPYVLFVGRLAEVKGPDLLLEAFARVATRNPDVSLVFGGPDFGMRLALEAAAARHGLEDRVVFTGHLDEGGRSAAYSSALFLAVPSRSEAMSLVALEAGILGTPVLLTDRCGFDEVDAVGGGMVVPATVEGLAGGLATMLDQRATLSSQGRALQNYVADHYAWPEVARKLLSAIKGSRRTRTGG